MSQELYYDVAVVGAGAAGVSTAIAAAKNGAKTVLIESSSVIGGDLLSGLPIDGCRTTGGEWIVGGIAKELFDTCEKFGGYVGSIYDRRNIWIVMINPRIMGFSIIRKLREYDVNILPYSQVVSVNREDKKIVSLNVANKTQKFTVKAGMYVDCTGDGDVAVMCDVPFEMGDESGDLQPMTMVFQMRNINPKEVLSFVLAHPENCGLAENSTSSKSAAEVAQELYDLGIPKVFFSSAGPLLKNAIQSGELHPCSMLAFTSNSVDHTAITVNTTRLVTKDCTGAEMLGRSMLELSDQVENAFLFVKNNIPGCQNASLDGIAPRLGIRESRRIHGEYRLSGDDVINGVKRLDGVCKGGHEVDIHGRDSNHIRRTIANAGSYDIPLGCMIPVGISNLMIAGRCLSSDRVAHSSARVMGTCMAMGQAVGTASALCLRMNCEPRELPIGQLRDLLYTQGAVLDGTD